MMEGLSQVGPGVGVATGVLVASHGVSFVWNVLWKREFATHSLIGLLFWPYVRMALVLAVVLSGLFVVKLNPGMEGATVMIVLRVLLKTIADAVTHLWEHRSLASPDTDPRTHPRHRLSDDGLRSRRCSLGRRFLQGLRIRSADGPLD